MKESIAFIASCTVVFWAVFFLKKPITVIIALYQKSITAAAFLLVVTYRQYCYLFGLGFC